jgi:hypothetical protein
MLDLMMIVLTVKRAIRLSRHPNAPPILRIVTRDGTWAFFLVWSVFPELFPR